METETRLELLEKDQQRLDWLEKNGCDQFGLNNSIEPDRRWFDSITDGADYSPSLREAIDKAMEIERRNTEYIRLTEQRFLVALSSAYLLGHDRGAREENTGEVADPVETLGRLSYLMREAIK